MNSDNCYFYSLKFKNVCSLHNKSKIYPEYLTLAFFTIST